MTKDFRQQFQSSADLKTFVRQECLQYFAVEDNQDDIVVIQNILESDKLDIDSVIYFDETSIERPGKSYDWSKLHNRRSDVTLIVSFQPLQESRKANTKPVKLTFPSTAAHIELTKCYRASSSIFDCLRSVQYLNIKMIDTQADSVNVVSGSKPIIMKYTSVEDSLKAWILFHLLKLDCDPKDLLIIYSDSTKADAEDIFGKSPFASSLRHWRTIIGCESLVVVCFCSNEDTWQMFSMVSRAQFQLFVLNRNSPLFDEVENVRHLTVTDAQNHVQAKAKDIKAKWSKTSHIPTIDEVTEAAKLAKFGYLRSVDRLVLKNIDVSSIDLERMSALCGAVTDTIVLDNVTGDIFNIVDNLWQCKQLESSFLSQPIDLTKLGQNVNVTLTQCSSDSDVKTVDALAKTGCVQSKLLMESLNDLWQSDAPLSEDDIVTTQSLIKTGHLPDLISEKADLISKFLSDYPKLPTVTTAASMAKLGLITSVENMRLWDIDIRSIPADNISALASVVTDRVEIYNVTGDIIPVLRSVKSRWLVINRMTLDAAVTKALVTAMETRVEEVRLGLWSGVRLDPSVLTQYDGHGKCRKVECWSREYQDTLRNWAGKVGWKSENGGWIVSRDA